MADQVKILWREEKNRKNDWLKFDQIGENTYRLKTGRLEGEDFRNRSWMRRFDEEFVKKYNDVAGNDDKFELNSSDTCRELDKFREALENGKNEIRLRVSR